MSSVLNVDLYLSTSDPGGSGLGMFWSCCSWSDVYWAQWGTEGWIKGHPPE